MTYSYQDDAVEWMALREDDKTAPGGFLCHEMGLGKTHIVCKHITATLASCPRTLILTTKSTINSWKDTLCMYSKFTYDVRVATTPLIVLHPTRPTVVVSTHNSVFNKNEWYLEQGFDRLIVDEAHVMRNMGKMFNRIIDLSKSVSYRWGITATPFNNKDRDMDSYMKFLRPNESVPAEVFKYYFLRKRRDDVLSDGPKLIFNKMVYDFEYPEERLMYDYVAERIDETHDWIDRNRAVLPWRVRGNMMLTLILRQRQAAIHPQLVLNAEKVWARQMGESYDMTWDHRKVTKLNKIAELVKADQDSCKNTLIITHFAEEMNMIRDRLIANGVVVRTLNGKTTPAKRALLEKKDWIEKEVYDEMKSSLPFPDDISGHIMSFLDNKPEVVILQIQAGGVGISLPWIHHVVNAAPDWNPFLEQQSIYRAYRVTTKHDVRVTAMYFRDTIEVSMQERQKEKFTRGAEWVDDPIESISEYIRMP